MLDRGGMKSKAFFLFLSTFVCLYMVGRGFIRERITIAFLCKIDMPSIIEVSILKSWVLVEGLISVTSLKERVSQTSVIIRTT